MSLRFLVEAHYARIRGDAVFWRPHVEEIARRHSLSMQPYEATLGDATNAVFFVGDSVVKIYTPYFRGRESKGMEPATLRALGGADGTLPIPKVKAHGELTIGSSDWNWPYVVMSRVKGRVLDADWPTLDDKAKRNVFNQLGALLKRVHAVPPSSELGEAFRKVWPRGFQEFLTKQLEALKLHPELAVLPFADEIKELTLLPVNQTWPKILHGDLEPAHLFYEGEKLTALIDFGDAKLGDSLYDFVLLIKSFGADKELLSAFFEGYGSDPREDDASRQLLGLYTTLHEWVTIKDLSKWMVKSGARTLRDLGEFLWAP